jgi:hypothetical protein
MATSLVDLFEAEATNFAALSSIRRNRALFFGFTDRGRMATD